jgi:hypothetical protein
MFVAEDVVLAETVIACTAGAVAELQIGMRGVRFAADSAFVEFHDHTSLSFSAPPGTVLRETEK